MEYPGGMSGAHVWDARQKMKNEIKNDVTPWACNEAAMARLSRRPALFFQFLDETAWTRTIVSGDGIGYGAVLARLVSITRERVEISMLPTFVPGPPWEECAEARGRRPSS